MFCLISPLAAPQWRWNKAPFTESNFTKDERPDHERGMWFGGIRIISTETTGVGGILPRRVVLQRMGGLVTAAAALSIKAAVGSATIKISKEAVAYQDHPDGDKRCGKCVQFMTPDSCKMVDGRISPQGYCRIFALREAA
jgi:hypothetical protein